MQLESVARGFASTPRADLAEPYAAKYFEVADWIWKNKTFHMAEALLEGLYPSYADPATLVDLGDAWLASHADATTRCSALCVAMLNRRIARSRCVISTRPSDAVPGTTTVAVFGSYF